MERFIFQNPGKLVFGEGTAVNSAGRELAKLGASKPALVTDETIAGTEMLKSVKAALGDSLTSTFTGVVPDTGAEIIDTAAEKFRAAGVDAVVSVGGGSTIDTAKAVAAVLGNECKSVREILGFGKLKSQPIPHVAIPTTAGTGSEVTSMAVVKDREAGKKILMLDPKMVPQAGILDPLFSKTMPKGITASTGMDALTHAAESIMSTKAMPPTDALALHAISLIAKSLPRAVADGDDLEARSMMLVASAEAGQAFNNAYVGIVHAMAHALGGLVGVPHGLANGILLWVGMEYNSQTVPERVAMIGQAMGAPMSGDAKADARTSVKAARDFTEQVGIETRLKMAGVKPECLVDAAELALADPSMGTNPRKAEVSKEIEELLKKCL